MRSNYLMAQTTWNPLPNDRKWLHLFLGSLKCNIKLPVRQWVLFIRWNGQTAVFDAATETFQWFPAVSTMPHCAAGLGWINASVGVMVTDAGFRKRTHFFQLAPPGSGEWQSFSTNYEYIEPVLGRLSSDTMILGGSPSIGVKHEMLQKLSPYWENKDDHIPFPTYGRGTQVPKSWIRHPLCG